LSGPEVSAYPEKMATVHPTPRTQVRRLPKRAVYSRDEINAILDEGFLCHVGFVAEGQPYVIPTGYARRGDEIFLHGSPASRMLRTLGGGVDVCVTVTLVDGFVLARSAFHHSVNYRSVVILGRARLVTEPAEKLEALRCFTNHIVPGRWDEVRRPTEQELKGTEVLALPLLEISAKVRKGPPVDDEADLALPVWAGVVPLRMVPGTPVPAEDVAAGALRIDTKRLTRFARPDGW
jgi:nitroimidazol reductase NimA-like FMN-containing flavoprotein (pyridoxamine 5'-phosphate oxidase superfamily)